MSLRVLRASPRSWASTDCFWITHTAARGPTPGTFWRRFPRTVTLSIHSLSQTRACPALDPKVTYRRPRTPFPRRKQGSAWLERANKLSWEVISWPLAGRKSDLLHSLYFAAPAFTPAPLIVTVHDAISLRPEHSHSRSAEMYSRFMRSATKKASRLITISEFSRREIAEDFGYPIERIGVTYEAAEPTLCRVSNPDQLQLVRDRYDLPGRFLLYLGGTERRKNIETIVRAWASGYPPGHRLVIVGRFPSAPDPLYPDMPALIASLGLSDTVHLLPFVDSADLAALYSMAEAFLFPSTYEGFGLPPLEAMSCGVPVLAADSTSLPEVLGDGAALLPATDIGRWQRAMIRVVEDRAWAEDLSQRGCRRAQTFTWARTASETLRIYDEVLSE